MRKEQNTERKRLISQLQKGRRANYEFYLVPTLFCFLFLQAVGIGVQPDWPAAIRKAFDCVWGEPCFWGRKLDAFFSPRFPVSKDFLVSSEVNLESPIPWDVLTNWHFPVVCILGDCLGLGKAYRTCHWQRLELKSIFLLSALSICNAGTH